MPIPTPPPASTLGPGTPGAVVHSGAVILGGVTWGGTDDYGVEWILEGLSGWSSPVASTGGVEQRPGAHGGWYGPASYGSRLVEVTGTLNAGTWGNCSDALDRLFAAVPVETPDVMVVDEGHRSLRALVRQEGDPLVERSDGWARVSLALSAADPRRYATELTLASAGLPITDGGLVLPLSLPLSVAASVSSGRIQVTNAGNLSTPPVFTVAGPCAAWKVTHLGSGRVMSSAESVPTGRVLTVDVGARTALLDGTSARVVSGSWFELSPGLNELAFSAASYDAGARLDVSFRSAWR